jgi:nucleotide-binding universal stress UspA family protein
MIRRILVPVDFSDSSALALRHAREWARLFDAELHLLTAAFIAPVWTAEGTAPIPQEYHDSIRKQASADLEELARPLREAGLRVSCGVSSDHPASAIRAAAESWSADLIAMGTHGRTGIAHAVLGSIAERTVRHAKVAVLTARADAIEPRPIRTILVPTDFSPDARAALDWAAALARHAGARLALVHAVAPPLWLGQEELAVDSVQAAQWAAEQAARSKLDRLAQELGGLVSGVSVEVGPPDVAVLDAARRAGADLIALGTRGRSGLAHVLLGSTAERVVRRAPVPVVVAKAPQERSAQRP